MIRKINLSDLQGAIDAAYEQYKDLHEGAIDPRIDEVSPSTFGISAVLTDGTVINKGNADAPVAMGEAVKIALASILLSQNTPEELIKKSGRCGCACGGEKPQKPHIPFSAHGIRAVSAIQPQNDPEGKWDIISSQLINMMGTSPVLDDKLLETLRKQALDAKVEDTLAAAAYYLYDNAPIAIDLYLKAIAMKASAQQLATMAATVAADGVNPVTNRIAFDGSIAANVTALVASKGPHKMGKPWLVGTGLPAKSGFGGCLVGILPGVMGIAAVSPLINPAEISVRAAMAIKQIMNNLQLSAFSSARVEFVK